MSAPVSLVVDQRGAARALTFLDHAGLVREEMTIETRPALDGRTLVTFEQWLDTDLRALETHCTPAQLRAAAAFFAQAAAAADVRPGPLL